MTEVERLVENPVKDILNASSVVKWLRRELRFLFKLLESKEYVTRENRGVCIYSAFVVIVECVKVSQSIRKVM